MNEYKYIAPRNQCNTWECRGFSNHALFDSGADDGNCNGPCDSAEDLPHLCDWIKAIAWMSHDEPRFGLSPLEIMKQSGASEESIHWITGFSGHSIGAPALAHSAEKSRWKELCGKYATRMAGCLVRLRDGGIYYGEESNQYCPNGNPDVSRCGIATICSNGIIGVNQRWNVKDRHSVCFYADAQHLEIVEGIPYPGDIPSQVFTPTNVIAHSDLHSISLVTHSRTQVT